MIENSTNVKVRTSDTALAVNLLLLLQVLVAILVSLEIL
ncbi:spore coat protein [Priestia megaterium]|nr:spore coat protein [Priestia megaterium]MDH3139279.1 spore coat protein [Priestia megaterium]MED4235870.1 spore coat protein [Priestia megaterium]MED4256342.1 spore coat protein [Priestia megaterium]